LNAVHRHRATGSALAVALLAAIVVPLTAHSASAAPVRSAATTSPACGTTFPAYQPRPVASGAALHQDLPIRMSDGVVLKADVTLPVGLAGPYPAALTITGYGKSSAVSGLGGGSSSSLVPYGYATVVVDDRGTGSSGGTWDSWGPRTIADYGEVLDWIVRQPWSDGRIGITGASYMGITSLFAASTGRPAVKAVFAEVPMADAYRDIVEAGSELNTAFIPLWLGLVTGLGLMPHGSPDNPQDLVDHLLGIAQFQVPTVADAAVGGAEAYDGPFWRQRSPIDVIDKVKVPTFIVGGLDDIFQRGEPLLYEHLANHVDSRLLLGPWTHVTTGSGLPSDGVPGLQTLLLQWFDQHVRGLPAQAECIPQVTQFVRGRGHYESAPSWPVPDLVADRWYLRGTGGLTQTTPGAGEPSRSYLELPVTGICSRSTNQWLAGLIDGTDCAKDDQLNEATSLTYTSPPFTRETVMNGPIEADVWVSTTSPDAAVSVSVSDVAPDGSSRGLSSGLLMASQRGVDPSKARVLDGQSIQPWHPFTAVAKLPVPAGQPMLLPIEVFPTSAAIEPGHRLRVSVAPYDVPHALPPLPGGLATLTGTVHVLSDASHPSSVVLPVVNAPQATAASAAVAATTTAGTARATGSRGPTTGLALDAAPASHRSPLSAGANAGRAALWVVVPAAGLAIVGARRRRTATAR
jgi:putative CocE/NonD family hydrolase